ncbi:MAG TPA: methyltransferase domain-containing protein [Planctomycetota bacterium]|nr:methyltransferase domain-containing protein [Planctomycetota bacterium]
MKPTEKAVRDANRRVFESKNYDAYDQNTSIFEHSRQQEIEGILASAPRREAMLDVGCGTGNVLRLAKRHFARCYGADLSRPLLTELRRREGLPLATAEAFHLPLRDAVVDLVSMYALVHHLLDPRGAFHEAYRVLKPGGLLYLDHDPNWYFGRFHHLYYRVRWSQSPGFGSWDAELSEWHHTRSGGLNPDRLRELLLRVGFRTVDVHYRITTNPALPLGFRVIRAAMRALARVHPFKSLHTHFRVLAAK